MDTNEIITLIILGALAGTAAASVMRWRSSARTKTGDMLRNTVIGILGAIVGGVLFSLLDIDLPEILEASISLADLIVAFIGAVIVILVIGFVRR